MGRNFEIFQSGGNEIKKIYTRESLQIFVSGSGKHILVLPTKKSSIANLKKKLRLAEKKITYFPLFWFTLKNHEIY